VGDRVLLKQTKTTTRPPWDPAPYEVTKVKGTQVTAMREGWQPRAQEEDQEGEGEDPVQGAGYQD
jgi:hypothetical protein